MQFSLHIESRFESLFLNCWKKIKKQKEKETYVSLSHHKELHFWTKKENTCTKKKGCIWISKPNWANWVGPLDSPPICYIYSKYAYCSTQNPCHQKHQTWDFCPDLTQTHTLPRWVHNPKKTTTTHCPQPQKRHYLTQFPQK